MSATTRQVLLICLHLDIFSNQPEQIQKMYWHFHVAMTFEFTATSELRHLCQIEALHFATNVSALELLHTGI